MEILVKDFDVAEYLQDIGLRSTAREIRRFSNTHPIFAKAFDPKIGFQRAVGREQVQEELGLLLSGKRAQTEYGSIELLQLYSRFSYLRSIARFVADAHQDDLSGEYNSVSDALMEEVDKIIRGHLGEPPLRHTIGRFGSKGRRGSDIFSDLDMFLVYEDGGSLERQIYFEKYASLFYEYMTKLEYKVDFFLRLDNDKKFGYYGKHRSNFFIQHCLGNLTAGIGEYASHFEREETNVAERTAVLESSYVLGDRTLFDEFVGVSTIHLEQKKLKELFLRLLQRDMEQKKSEYNPAKLDLKLSYGGLLSGTIFLAYLRACGAHAITPTTVISMAQKSHLITPTEGEEFETTTAFLRKVRNWNHVLNETLDTYMESGPKDRMTDGDKIADNMLMKPEMFRRMLYDTFLSRQKLFDRVMGI